jgi:hypothetical protein
LAGFTAGISQVLQINKKISVAIFILKKIGVDIIK